MKRVRIAALLTLTLSLLLIDTANAALRAWLDHNQVASGDTVQLTLEHQGQVNSQPDLSSLKQDFDVLSSSRSSNIEIINGSTSSRTQLMLTLSPKHNGSLTIPAITWDGDQSAPLALSVSNASNPQGTQDNATGQKSNTAASGQNKVLIETTVDQQQPYVQAAVAVTVKLFVAEPLYHASLDLAASGDVLVQKVGADERSTALRGAQHYDVIARHYLVFPQHSGKVSLPGAELNAQVAVQRANDDPFGDDRFGSVFGQAGFGNMLTSTKPIRLHGDDIQLNVRPRPNGAGANYWLPARNVTLTATWHPDNLQAHVGEPITLDLQLRAEGLTAEQLPNLASLLSLPNAVKLYPDQAKLTNTVQGDTVLGTRSQSIALIADQAGSFVLPALHVQWWDTKADTARDVELPARTLTILPAVGGNGNATITPEARAEVASSAPVPQPTSKLSTNSNKHDVGVWLWVSVALAVLWLATLVAWLLSRRRNASTPKVAPTTTTAMPSANIARSAFRTACTNNAATAARHHLLNWAAAIWSEDPPQGLQALATRLNDAKIAALLRDLDRACYLGGAWSGKQLVETLTELRKPKQQKTQPNEIAELYP